MAEVKERGQKNELRKMQIIEGSIAVLKEKGVAASSMNDFIKSSGLSKGGVYHHFKSKEDLLIGVLNYFFEQHVTEISDADLDDLPAYDHMRHFLVEREELLVRVGELNHLMMDFFAHATTIESIKKQFHYQYCHFQDHIAEMIQKGIDSGEFKNTIDPKAIATGFIGVFDGVGSARVVAPDRVQFPTYAVETALIMLEGIRA